MAQGSQELFSLLRSTCVLQVMKALKINRLNTCIAWKVSKGSKLHHWLKNTVILLNGWILPIGGVASERVCVCSLRSKLFSVCSQLLFFWFYLPFLVCVGFICEIKLLLMSQTNSCSFSCIFLLAKIARRKLANLEDFAQFQAWGSYLDWALPLWLSEMQC